MSLRIKKAIISAINVLLFLTLLLLQYAPYPSLNIGNASPMLTLSFVIAVSMFCSELNASLIGMAVGIFTDTSSVTSFGFNSLVFFVIAFLTSFLIHYLFNNNFRSGIALGIMFSTLYFILRWLFFFVRGNSVTESFSYLFQHALPSVIYTAVVTLLLYFLEKSLFKKIS